MSWLQKLLPPRIKAASGVARLADAVVIGSRIVQEMADAGDNAAARAGEVLREFRDAMDNKQALAT